jgi:hypothetical protein
MLRIVDLKELSALVYVLAKGFEAEGSKNGGAHPVSPIRRAATVVRALSLYNAEAVAASEGRAHPDNVRHLAAYMEEGEYVLLYCKDRGRADLAHQAAQGLVALRRNLGSTNTFAEWGNPANVASIMETAQALVLEYVAGDDA